MPAEIDIDNEINDRFTLVTVSVKDYPGLVNPRRSVPKLIGEMAEDINCGRFEKGGLVGVKPSGSLVDAFVHRSGVFISCSFFHVSVRCDWEPGHSSYVSSVSCIQSVQCLYILLAGKLAQSR
jgi:hypothetical protein